MEFFQNGSLESALGALEFKDCGILGLSVRVHDPLGLESVFIDKNHLRRVHVLILR